MKLTAEQIDRFEEEGFLVVRQALGDADLDPVIEEYEAHIERRAGELKAEARTASPKAWQEAMDAEVLEVVREALTAGIEKDD